MEIILFFVVNPSPEGIFQFCPRYIQRTHTGLFLNKHNYESHETFFCHTQLTIFVWHEARSIMWYKAMKHVKILRLYLKQSHTEWRNPSVAINWNGIFTERYQGSLLATAWQILTAERFFSCHLSRAREIGSQLPKRFHSASAILPLPNIRVPGWCRLLPVIRTIQILKVGLSSFHNLIRRRWTDK